MAASVAYGRIAGKGYKPAVVGEAHVPPGHVVSLVPRARSLRESEPGGVFSYPMVQMAQIVAQIVARMA